MYHFLVFLCKQNIAIYKNYFVFLSPSLKLFYQDATIVQYHDPCILKTLNKLPIHKTSHLILFYLTLDYKI